ncbi:MAG: DUF4136 domain-containing protein [Candidatus Cloacimonadales bacterium]|nr:DUF4136 domain-containing protein [Candidatus Cloacimonadales bacterium]
MKAIKLAALVLIVLSFLGCSTIYVAYDYDVEADFSKYHTFRWAKDVDNKSNSIFDNPLMDKRLKNALNLELENKGYEKTDQNADFILAYEQASHMEEDVYVSHYSHGWRHHGFGFGLTNVSKDRYMEGMITLKIYDGETDELIWQGWASGIRIDVENIAEIINETAQKFVEKFPPSRNK